MMVITRAKDILLESEEEARAAVEFMELCEKTRTACCSGIDVPGGVHTECRSCTSWCGYDREDDIREDTDQEY